MALVACALLASAACEQVEEVTRADPVEAADLFVHAWTDGDFEAMSAATGEDARGLERAHDRLFAQGRLEGLSVARAGAVEEPPEEAFGEDATEPPLAEVPYELTLGSVAAADPVVLEGSFEMTYDAGEDRWSVVWSRSLLLPEPEGARRLQVAYRWPKRAPILDRDGAVLARGAAERREYPQGAVAGTTVGHLEPLAPQQVRQEGLPGAPGDLVGASGLEAAFQDRLAGEPASRLEAVDRRGEVVEVLGRARGAPGRTLRTTLDVDVQRAAERAYGSTTGGAVVLDPRDGDLLAVVSSSPFDPGNYVGVPGIEPFNRALSGLYPPGSAMKVMTAAAALDTGVMKESTELTGPAEYRGVRNFESGEFGTIDFATALKFSVNTAFAQVALKLGAKRITEYAERFGFNDAPAMALQAATSSFPRPQDEGDLMWGSIGQAQTLSTPLQMATVAATVANGGKRMEPRIDKREPPRGRRAIKASTAAVMTRLMQNVVQGGTGTAANVSGLAVAGKTGTAEVDVAGERRNHAWFICFAPGGAPKVAIAVVSEYGGVGGQVAAPLARDILLAVMPHVR